MQRKVKNAKDLETGGLIYFAGHAKATFMSDGRTVEDRINAIETGGGVDLTGYATEEYVNSQVSSKQDKISNLESIIEGAAKGASALQSVPSEYITETELTNKGYATTSDLNNKVDKVNGKQLSTEDFTTALKTKLEGLNNYDDTTINTVVTALRRDFDELVSGDTTTAIKTFNEVIAFLDGISDSQDLDSIIAGIEQQIAGKMDKVTLATVATSGSYNDLSNKPTIPSAVTESTVSGWGFTKNTGTYSKPSGGIPKTDLASTIQTSLDKADTALQSHQDISGKQDKLISGTNIKTINNTSILGSGNISITGNSGTITGVSANGTSIATSGVANIPAASTSAYGVTKLSSATNSTSTTLAATASAVKASYDLANGKQDKLVSVTNIKTVNGTSILGSGDITISGGSSDANVQAVDTGDVLDDVNVDYATTAYVDNKIANISLTDYATITYVDGLVGDINSVLESIINGGVRMISFVVKDVEYQAEEGMTWGEFVYSDLHPGDFYMDGEYIYYYDDTVIISNLGVYITSHDTIIENHQYVAEPIGSGN